MKFGNLLRASADEAPALEPLWVCYKQLKKHLKRFPKSDATGSTAVAAAASVPVAAEPRAAAVQQAAANDGFREQEAQFVSTLSNDVDAFNETFLEKEEDCIIRLRELQDAADAALVPAAANEEAEPVYRELVNFHGELLLLLHWSILAYTALVKILKKHHKRTGLLLNAPEVSNLLSQPFCSVEVMTDMVRKAECHISKLAEKLGVPHERISGEGSRRVARAGPTQSTATDSHECGPIRTDLDKFGPTQLAATNGGTAAGAEAVAAAAGTVVADEGRAAGVAAGGVARKRRRGEGDEDEEAAAAEEEAGNATAGVGGAVAPRAAAALQARLSGAGLPAQGSIMRQTKAALGLWEQLVSTAATPSTVYREIDSIEELVPRIHSATSTHNSGT